MKYNANNFEISIFEKENGEKLLLSPFSIVRIKVKENKTNFSDWFKNDIGLKYLDKNTGIYTLDLRIIDLKKNKFEAVLTDRTDIVLTITYGKLLDIEVLSNYDYLINELKYILN